MAKYMRKAFSALLGFITYPRSVFDLSPSDPDHFPNRSPADALREDWHRLGDDLRRASAKVYGNG